MKILLVVANYSWFHKRPWGNLTPAVPIITAILKNEFELSVLDANVENYSIEQTEIKMKESNADIVLITALSTEYYKAYHMIGELAKRVLPSSYVLMGGVYPTVCPENVIEDENIDFVMIGHAEERLDYLMKLFELKNFESIKTFPGIAYKDDGKAVIRPLDKYISDVKLMVKPDYSLSSIEKYINNEGMFVSNFVIDTKGKAASVITSYGCPYNCLFCATRTISGRKVAYRPADDVLEEIEFLVKEQGVNSITFLDDCLLADKKRAKYIFEEMIKREYNIEFRIGTVAAWHLDREILELMKKAGCSRFGISIESGCERVLHEIVRKPLKLEIIPGLVKICRELDILMSANFIIGFPGETWEEIRESMRYAEECDFDLINIHIATVLPKTDLYKLAKESKSLPNNFSFFEEDINFGFGKGNITTDEFTPNELGIIRSFEWDRINFSTPEKRKRACRVMEITSDQLEEHRKQTRINCGIYFA